MPSSKLDNSEHFSEILSNLKLDADPAALAGSYGADTYKYAKSNDAFNSDSQATDFRTSLASNGLSNLHYKSKYKTIKIFVASNKNGKLLHPFSDHFLSRLSWQQCFFVIARIRTRKRMSAARDTAGTAAVLFAVRLWPLFRRPQPQLRPRSLRWPLRLSVHAERNRGGQQMLRRHLFLGKISLSTHLIFMVCVCWPVVHPTGHLKGLLGNKYGAVPLPVEIGKAEFESIVSAAKSLGLGKSNLFEH